MPRLTVAHEETVCVKGVPEEHAEAAKAWFLRSSTGIQSVFATADKAGHNAGKVLLYLNYVSEAAAVLARDEQRASVAEWWPPAWGRLPSIVLKSNLVSPYFALFVKVAPETCLEDLQALCSEHATVHPSGGALVPRNDEALFVNFEHYSGALSVLEAGRRGALCLNSMVCEAYEARNTSFISAVIEAMQKEGPQTFGPVDVARVVQGMHEKEWPPTATGMWGVVEAASDVFEFFPCGTKFRLKKSAVQAAQKKNGRLLGHQPSSINVDVPYYSTPQQSPEEKTLGLQRKAAVDMLLQKCYQLLSEIFTWLWYKSNGSPWVDSYGWPSTTTLKLVKEMGMSEPSLRMQRPVSDWDLWSLLTALCRSSAKDALPKPNKTNVPEGDSLCTRVLVDCHILSEQEYMEQFVPHFHAYNYDPYAALCTVRCIRNIMCHMPGSVCGLTKPAFECLWELLTGSLKLLATCMGTEHMVSMHKQHADMFEAMSTVNFRIPCQPSPTVERAVIYYWSCEDVIDFFTQHGFTTIGVEIHGISGLGLVLWYKDTHARHKFFTASVPWGLGLSPSEFDLRFRHCMDRELERAAQ